MWLLLLFVFLGFVVVFFFDYIIVGGGIVGLVIVNCFLENFFICVVVIEFGDD